MPERMRWRAAAYVTPRLDDFIVGFVFADFDTEGRLRIQADANRVQLQGRPLFTEYRESAFGFQGLAGFALRGARGRTPAARSRLAVPRGARRMRRGVAAVAGLAVVTAAIALLTRPLLHSLRADTVTVSLGHPARARRTRPHRGRARARQHRSRTRSAASCGCGSTVRRDG